MTPNTSERRPSVGASILLALALVAVVQVVPSLVAGEAPSALNFNPQTFHNTITSLGLDAAGRYAVVGIQESKAEAFLNQPEIAVLDLSSPTTSWTAIGQGFTQSNPMVHVAAAPGKPGDSSGASKFVVGGSEGYLTLFDRSGNSDWTCHRANAQVTDLAMSRDGDYVLASFANPGATTQQGHLGAVVLYGPTVKGSGDCGRAPAVNTTRQANVVAIPSGAMGNDRFHHRYFAVGTDDLLRVYFSDSLTGGDQAWTMTTIDGPVTSMQFSSDGHELVVGTSHTADAGGTLYFLGLTKDGKAYQSYTWRFDRAVTSVAISADARILAAGTAGGEVKVFRNISTPDVHAADPRPSFLVPGGNSVTDLSIDASGTYVVASAGSHVYGLYGATGERLWTLNLGGTVSHAAISQNAGHLAVTTGDQFYGYKLQPGLSIKAPQAHRGADPLGNVTYPLTLTNTGSQVGNYSLAFQYPSGWQQVTPDEADVLLPGRNLTIPVDVSVPNRTAPGTYPTVVRVFDQDANRLLRTVYLNTTVRAVQNVKVQAPDHDLQVNASVPEVYAFTVKNTGNSVAYLNFTLVQHPSTGTNWDLGVKDYQTDPKVVPIQVPRGGQKVVNLQVQAPNTAVDGDFNKITVYVQAGNATHQVTRSVSLTARVNPVFAIDTHVDRSKLNFTEGQSRAVELRLVNSGNSIDTVNLTATIEPASLRQDWAVVIPQDVRLDNITLGRGASRTVVVTIHPTGSHLDAATVVLHVNSTGGVRKDVKIAVGPQTKSTNQVPLPSPGALVAALAAAALVTARRRRLLGPGR